MLAAIREQQVALQKRREHLQQDLVIGREEIAVIRRLGRQEQLEHVVRRLLDRELGRRRHGDIGLGVDDRPDIGMVGQLVDAVLDELLDHRAFDRGLVGRHRLHLVRGLGPGRAYRVPETCWPGISGAGIA